MFTLVRNTGVKHALRNEAVPMLMAFVVAELFFKFHSFALETGAFLLTWLALSYLGTLIRGRLPRAG